MVTSTRPPANAFVAQARKLYNPIGFTKGYNFILWFILCGALLGFILARLMFFDINGIFCPRGAATGPQGALPGECYYYTRGIEKPGIILHLAGILPAGFLVILQFVPVIRHKAILFHRINGYLVMLLGLVSTIGIFMIARHSFGGTLGLQTATGMAGIIFIVGHGIAYYNIKMLQIEQHRAWMIRTWGISTFIITMRLIGAIMARIVSGTGPSAYYLARPCAVIDYIYHSNQTHVESLYPSCSTFYSGANPDQNVLVRADMTAGPDHIASSYLVSFAAGGWLAIFIHALAAEIYLRLTPAESERLRRVSYQRQVEAGMKNPGNMGLTVQRLGDAEPWVFPGEDAGGVKRESVAESEAEKTNGVSN